MSADFYDLFDLADQQNQTFFEEKPRKNITGKVISLLKCSLIRTKIAFEMCEVKHRKM